MAGVLNLVKVFSGGTDPMIYSKFGNVTKITEITKAKARRHHLFSCEEIMKPQEGWLYSIDQVLFN